MFMLVENEPQDLEPLVKATIVSVTINEENIGFRVRYAEGLLVNDSEFGEYQIWRDVEGNGPGYLALIGH